MLNLIDTLVGVKDYLDVMVFMGDKDKNTTEQYLLKNVNRHIGTLAHDEISEPLYRKIARLIAWDAPENFQAQKDAEIKHCESNLPHGSGFDAGCKINMEESTEDKIVIDFEYHHMVNGYYVGWTRHKLIVTPSFKYDYNFDFELIQGDYSHLREYLVDYIHSDLDYSDVIDIESDADYFLDQFCHYLSQQVFSHTFNKEVDNA